MPISLGFWEWGCPKRWARREGKGPRKEVAERKERQEGENGFTFPISFPWSLALRHYSLAFRARLYAK